MDNQNQNTNVIFPAGDDNGLQSSSGFSQPLAQPQSLEPTEVISTQPQQAAFVQPQKQEKIAVRLVKRADVLLAVLLVLGSVGLVLNSYVNKEPTASNAAGRYETTQIPLSDFVTSDGISFGTQSVIINGSLQANDGLIISPTLQPTTAVAGQMYYDQTSNLLSYYNGTQFVPVGSGVQSVGGLTGQVAAGTGLSAAGGQLSNTGVLSVQGLTGDVTLAAGNGIAISGTTISNTGVVSVASSSPSIVVTTDGSGNVTLSGSGSGTVDSPGGTAGKIPVFTAAQTIADSIITQSGMTVTVAGDLAVVTGGLTLSNALTVSNGGTGAASLALNGVLIGQGTGAITSVTSGGAGLCLVSTAGAPTWAACPGGAGVDSLNGLTGALSIANASGAGNTVTIDDASTSTKGIAQFNVTNFSAGAGIINTVQNINTGATPTFAGVNTNSITPSGALTVGATSQTLTLQGNGGTTITATSGANTTTVGFTAPSANTTINFPALSAGSYDLCTTSGNCLGGGGGGANTSLSNLTSVAINTTLLPGAAGGVNLGSATLPFGDFFMAGTSGTPGTNNFRFTGASTGGTRTITIPDAGGTMCLTTGNCAGAGGGVTTPGGTIGTLPVFTGTQALGDSLLSQSGGVVTVDGHLNLTAGNQYRINGTQISSANLSNDANLAKLSASQTFTGTSNAFQNGANSTNAFNVQNALGSRLLTVDTSNGEVELGTGSLIDGALVFNNVSNNNTVKIVPGTPSDNRTITLPDDSGIVCLNTGNCAGAGATLQTGYNFSVGGTTPKIKVNSSLGAVDIQDADTTIAGNLLNVRASNAGGLGSVMFGVASTGAITMQNATNSTTALRVLSAGGTSVLTIDTQNGQTILGQSGTLAGNLVFRNATNANTGTLRTNVLGQDTVFTLPDPVAGSAEICLNTGNCLGGGSGGANSALSNLTGVAINTTLLPGAAGAINLGSGTLPFGDLFLAGTSGTPATNNFRITGVSTGGTQIITLPDATGTVCLQNATACGFALSSGDGDYIQNGTSQQTANFNITSGAGTGVPTATVEQVDNSTIGGFGLQVIGGANPGANAFHVQNSAGTQVFGIDTSNSRTTIGSGTGCSGRLCVGQSVTSGGATSNNLYNTVTVNTASPGTVNLHNVQLDDDSSSIANTINLFNLDTTASTNASATINTLVAAIDSGQPGNFINMMNGGTSVLTLTNSGVATFRNQTNSISAFQVQTTGGSSLLAVDTTNNAVYINGTGASGSGGKLHFGENNITVGEDTGDSDALRLEGLAGVAAYTHDAGMTLKGEGANGAGNRLYFGENNTFIGETGYLTETDSDALTMGGLQGVTIFTGGSTAGLTLSATSQATFLNETNSATAFQVQDTATAALLTVDTATRGAGGGNLIKIGNSTGTDGALTILQLDASTADPTSNLAALNGGLFYNSTTNKVSLIENGQIKVICNTTDLGCGTGTVTLQDAYDNSTTPEITLDATRGALTIRDNATPIGANLFEVTNNAGGTTYLGVTSSAATLGSNVDLLLQGATAYISNPQTTTLSEVFGNGANTTGDRNVVVGNGATSGSDSDSVAIGYLAVAADDSVVVGSEANCTNNSCVAIGWQAVAAFGGTSLGNGASANSNGAIALGGGATTGGANSIALGSDAVTTAANQLVIGSTTAPISQVVVGNGVTNGTPAGFTLQGTSGSGSNIAGASINIGGGQSTGSANGGSLNLQISVPGGAGSGLNSLTTVATFSGVNGSALLKNAVNSTAAFQVQNSAGTGTVLDVDTTNQRLGVNTATPSSLMQVNQSNLTPGTVSNSAASASVTGSGTTFLTTFQPGDTFTITSTGNTCTVQQITSNTALVCRATLASLSSGSAYSFTQQARLGVSDNGMTTLPGTLMLSNPYTNNQFSFRNDESNNTLIISGNIVGNASNDGGSDSNANYIQATKFNSGTGGTINSLRVYFPSVDGGNPGFKVAVYSDSAGSPNTLLSSATAPSTVATAAAWNTASLGTTVTLAPNTDYWLATSQQSSGTTFAIQNIGTNTTKYQSGFTYSGNFPGTYTVTDTTGHVIAIYAPYITITDQSAIGSALRISENNEVAVRPISDSDTTFEVLQADGGQSFNVNTWDDWVGMNQLMVGAVDTTYSVYIRGAESAGAFGARRDTSTASDTIADFMSNVGGTGSIKVKILADGTVQVAGGGTRDITTRAAGALGIQPATTTSSNGTGGALNLRAADSSSTTCGTACTGGAVTLQGGSATGASGTTRNGGAVSIEGGTGATNNGAINIGTVNSSNVTVGRASGTTSTTLQGGTGGVNVGVGGVANTVQIGNITGAVTQGINIGTNATGSSTNNVTIGSTVAGTTAIRGATTITNRTSGSADTLIVSNSTSTGTIALFRDNATAVLTLADGGNATFQPVSASTSAFRVLDTDGTTVLLGVDSSADYLVTDENLSVGLNAEVGEDLIVDDQFYLGGQSNSSEAFMVYNLTNVLFRIDGADSRVYIGDPAADTTGALLILDTKSDAGDPTGVNGGMYYNSNTNAFRCYENSVWYDCISRHKIVLATDVIDNTGVCTNADVTGLSFSVVSGRSYRFHATINYSANATATGAQWTATGPANNYFAMKVRNPTSSSSDDLLNLNVSDGGNCSASSFATSGNLATIEGIIEPTTSGTVQIRMATEVNGGAITAEAGSTLEWW